MKQVTMDIIESDAVVLMGLPAVGKNAWIDQENEWGRLEDFAIISTDGVMEDFAERNGLDYNVSFHYCNAIANERMQKDLETAAEDKKRIIWNQTNTAISKREKIVKQLKALKYESVCCLCFLVNNWTDYVKRLNSREGKIIPANNVRQMIGKFELGSMLDGFDEVYYMNQQQNPIDLNRAQELSSIDYMCQNFEKALKEYKDAAQS